MKKFIKTSLLFALCLIGICLAFELYLLGVDNEYAYKRHYLENNADAIKVLVMGHSHAAYGIDPEVMGDSIFNAAISGQHPYYTTVIAERYLHTMKNLKVVIWAFRVDAQYESYKSPLPPKSQYVTSYQCMYEKYWNISYEPELPYAHWSELLSSKLNYVTRSFKSTERKRMCHENGYGILGKRADDWKTGHLPQPVDYANPNAALAFHENIGYYKRLAKACKDAGARFVVIGIPYYKTAQECLTERGWAEKKQCIDSMRSVNPQLEYYEFCYDPRFNEDDFSDATHLGPHGARKFSAILADTLQQHKAERL